MPYRNLLPWLLAADLLIPFFLAPAYKGYSLYFFKTAQTGPGLLSFVCFVLATGFFTLFVMADKPRCQGTFLGLEGLWQRLSLLCMYLPIAALCYGK